MGTLIPPGCEDPLEYEMNPKLVVLAHAGLAESTLTATQSSVHCLATPTTGQPSSTSSRGSSYNGDLAEMNGFIHWRLNTAERPSTACAHLALTVYDS